jgi:hypothetical protein
MEGEAEDFVIDENGDLCPIDWETADLEDSLESVEEEATVTMVVTDVMMMRLFRIPREDVPALQIALKALMTTALPLQ